MTEHQPDISRLQGDISTLILNVKRLEILNKEQHNYIAFLQDKTESDRRRLLDVIHTLKVVKNLIVKQGEQLNDVT